MVVTSTSGRISGKWCRLLSNRLATIRAPGSAWRAVARTGRSLGEVPCPRPPLEEPVDRDIGLGDDLAGPLLPGPVRGAEVAHRALAGGAGGRKGEVEVGGQGHGRGAKLARRRAVPAHGVPASLASRR